MFTPRQQMIPALVLIGAHQHHDVLDHAGTAVHGDTSQFAAERGAIRTYRDHALVESDALAGHEPGELLGNLVAVTRMQQVAEVPATDLRGRPPEVPHQVHAHFNHFGCAVEIRDAHRRPVEKRTETVERVAGLVRQSYSVYFI